MARQGRPTGEGSKGRARRLAASLTLEDQVALLAGKDFWRTVDLPSKGIPSIKVTDGPNGARGEFFTDGTPAALFPCGVSLAATWNVDVLREVGEHLAAETKARGAHVLLAPTVCLHRSPLGGRNFESFSEDPLLTGKLAAAYITGLQSKGVAATIKHFVGNEQETQRMSIDSKIDERALRELYLKPFEIAIRDADPWALMTAYNLVNGVHADMNTHTVRDILRDEWNYDGMVMSDWTGVNSVAESIAAGCDLEMPGSTQWRGQRAIEAVKSGKLSAADVESCAANVLYLVERTKGLDGPAETPERADNVPERRDLIRRLGHEGLTLLKNESVLPLPNHAQQTVAVIGLHAAKAVAHGGGSASLRPYYTISPLEGIQAAAQGKVIYAQGCDSRKWLPLLSDHAQCVSPSGKPGVALEYFRGEQFTGPPAHTTHRTGTDLYLWDAAPADVLPAYAFRSTCTLTPATSGNHAISLQSVGPGRLFVDGKQVIDNWNWVATGETMLGGSDEVVAHVSLAAGQAVTVVAESTNATRPLSKIAAGAAEHWFGGCRIGFQEAYTTDMLEDAMQAAKAADVAIVCVGLDAEWESEGYDRKTMDLPPGQDALIAAVAAANPRTVVVNQSGSPVSMPWADDVPAILQAWYGGQEAGNALADVLFGKANPGGRLPVSFPVSLDDTPAAQSWTGETPAQNWPGVDGQACYSEGLFMGYRYYDRESAAAPRFPFGHGLSYTSFEYGAAILSGAVLGAGDGDDLSVDNYANGNVVNRTTPSSSHLTLRIPIRNTGDRAGSETVQLYVRAAASHVPRPEKELAAFAKVFLQPGEQQTVELVLDKHAVSFYDTARSAWVAERGEYLALVGASSRDIRARCGFTVTQSFMWDFGADEGRSTGMMPAGEKAQARL